MRGSCTGTTTTYCAQCGPGKYSSSGGSCQNCQGGTYNPNYGQSSCNRCPSGWDQRQTEGIRHVKKIIFAGTFLPLEPQSAVRAKSCVFLDMFLQVISNHRAYLFFFYCDLNHDLNLDLNTYRKLFWLFVYVLFSLPWVTSRTARRETSDNRLMGNFLAAGTYQNGNSCYSCSAGKYSSSARASCSSWYGNTGKRIGHAPTVSLTILSALEESTVGRKANIAWVVTAGSTLHHLHRRATSG